MGKDTVHVEAAAGDEVLQVVVVAAAAEVAVDVTGSAEAVEAASALAAGRGIARQASDVEKRFRLPEYLMDD